ncbi:MAG: GatB/YqeY domain-containing protein [Desulfuromonadaceae bacterium]|nr:GatB/YqeY domain-containing protein [Desulfuromonas sp.]MDY0185679.1 GatB/YqeY domain-containing protein [Desulfuromonadaceae bacterium]
MSLQNTLTNAMKDAMRSKQSARLGVIRMLRSAIKNVEIEQKQELSDDDIISLLATQVKQRRDAAQAFREGSREDLALKEEAEIVVLQEFMPTPLSAEEVGEIIEIAVQELNASSMQNMGKVMQQVSAVTRGRAEGRVVSDMVKQRLARQK